MVDPLGRSKCGSFQISCRIADTVARSPLLMAETTRERTGQDETSRAAVFVGTNMAVIWSAEPRLVDDVSGAVVQF